MWSLAVSTRRETLLLDVAAEARPLFANGRPAEMETSPSLTRAVLSVVSEPDARRRLYTTSLSSFDPQPIGDFSDSVGYPVWSPDERLLAVEIKDGSSTQAGIVDLSTGRLTRLTQRARPDVGAQLVTGWAEDRGGHPARQPVEPAVDRRAHRRARRDHVAGPPNVYVRYPAWSSRSDVVVFERGELHGNIWMVPLS